MNTGNASPRHREINLASPTLLLTFFLLCVGVLLYANYDTTAPSNFSELKDPLAESKKIAIEMLRTRSELMASWGIAIIASLGFIFNYIREKDKLNTALLLVGFVAFLGAFVTVALSHLQFDAMIRPLLVGEDPTQDLTVFNLFRAQFFSLMISVILFVAFILYVTFPDLIQKMRSGDK